MADIIPFPQESEAYACADCQTAEVICFTDGQVMCNSCGEMLDLMVINVARGE